MNFMRQWINLVENAIKPASAQLIARITADTEENRKHIENLKSYEKEIEDEEQQSFAIPSDVQRAPAYGTKEWEQHSMWLDYEVDKKRREQELVKCVEAKKAELEQAAKIQGIRLAAKDAMDDMIVKDREVVSKLAKQALGNTNKNKERIRKQAMRQLKKH